MKRFIENKLNQWFMSTSRKPLILRGARQVGKSTLVEQFTTNSKINLVSINLERFPQLDSVFASMDPRKIILELEGLSGRSIQTENTLLFLDEIQATPHALPALRYLREDFPQLPIIAAGSLLEFVLAKHEFSMPVGRVEYLHMGPMTFKEFLLALNETHLIEQIELATPGSIATTVHERLLQRQREYLFVGGMPESVACFATTQSLTETQQVLRSIAQTYQDDFIKYATPSQRSLLHTLFYKIPQQAGQKIKYVNWSREDRAREVRASLQLLIQAKVLLPVYHSSANGVPLRATQNSDIYKLYFMDVGLLNQMSGLTWNELQALSERELVHEGVLAEQFIAQHLFYRDGGLEIPELHYWLRERKLQNAEVDFLIARGREILPIEVKSGKSGRLRSLACFLEAKPNTKNAIRFDLNLPSTQPFGTTHLISLPLYLVEEATRIGFG